MVERASAVINEQIALRIKFQYGTGDYFDPYEISKVEILDEDGETIIETITGDDIIRDSEGNYHVVASAISEPKNSAYDKWYFTHPEGATEQTKTNTFVVYEVSASPEVEIVVGTNSWITVPEANEYFAGRLGASTFWTATAEKTAALVTAYRQIMSCVDFSIDAAEDDQAVKDAQCEMALFLLQHMSDMDARKGLQVQGVTQAQIVGETYNPEAAEKVAIPANVKNMLSDYESGSPLLAANVERDDDEDA